MTTIFLYLKSFLFKQRKNAHYALLASVVLLQLVAIGIWYNESKLADAFDDMAWANKQLRMTHQVKDGMIASQQHFNDYLANGNEESLGKYRNAIGTVVNKLGTLRKSDRNNEKFVQLLAQRDHKQFEIDTLQSAIDSILGNPSGIDRTGKPFAFKPFESDAILDNVKTDYYFKVDPTAKKGLFSRLADAFSGKVSIQKQYLNTVIKMRYKDKVMTGDVEEQLANTIRFMNQYYEDQFTQLKRSFSSLRSRDRELLLINNKLLQLTGDTLSIYDQISGQQEDPTDSYLFAKSVRGYGLVVLILLMLFITVLLIGFTRQAFHYEKRLLTAQDQIQQSLDFKNRITAMISHEIRSPLSVVSVYTRMASEEANTEELKQTLNSITFTVDSLLLLSNQILEYSKDANRRLEAKNSEWSLATEIDKIVNSMQPLLKANGNDLQFSSNIDSQLVVYADAAKVYQLFYNLIGNANKFTENGYIKVVTKLETISEYEADLRVTIADNGRGIAQNDLENVFDAYHQGAVSHRVNDLGVGLGLNICREIVELFDGNIQIASDQGAGTTVNFNLILTLQ